jgi:16S rRNA (adenine1518-N6/adenine1519-N6)-dimethyltransferase
MQKLGQHFLKNAAALEKIAAAVAPADGELIIEIGPGHGELTIPLIQALQKVDGRIFCIEKDQALIAELKIFAEKENSAGNAGHMNIIEGDALKLLPEVVSGFSLNLTQEATKAAAHPVRYKIAGNIPYYITGKLLRIISELEHKPERTVLLIQKEVAERICAAPPDMNRLAASVQFWANARVIAHVPRKDFSPPPDVDSAVIVLDKKDAEDAPLIEPALYYRAVRAIFAQPRKTILNNVSDAAREGAKKDTIAVRLQKIGVDPGARPQDLDMEQIVAVAKADLVD